MSGVTIALDVELLLKHRDDTRRFKMTAIIPEEVEAMDDMMHYVTGYILTDIDTVGQNRMVLEDDRGNIHITLISELQGISIYAPDKLPEGLGGGQSVE